MAIGKPLLITEKQPVQTPVLAAQTTPLSPNVAAQKLSFADYGIGQANAKASFAVTDELINMASVVGQAAVYVDKTKKEHVRLDMMKDWQETDSEFAEQYADAVTYAEKTAVISGYKDSIGTRAKNYQSVGGSSIEAQKSLASLSNASRSALSKMNISSAQRLVSETKSGYDLEVKKITEKIKNDPTADLGIEFQKFRDIENQRVKMGLKTREQAEFDQIIWQRAAHVSRGGLEGKAYAKSYIEEGLPLPDDSDILKHYTDRTEMTLDEISSKAYIDSVHSVYVKKIRQFNTEETAERTATTNSYYEEKRENTRLLDSAMATRELDDSAVQVFTAIAKSFGPEYEGLIEGKINSYLYGAANAGIVAQYTDSAAVRDIQNTREYMSEGFIDIDKVVADLPSSVNENEKAAITRKLLEENQKISKDIKSQVANVGSGVLGDILSPKTALGKRASELISDSLNEEIRLGLAKGGRLNWKEVMSADSDLGAIWNGVISTVKGYYDLGKGKADPEYMKGRTATQRFEDMRGMLETEFTTQIVAKLDDLADLKAEAAATEAEIIAGAKADADKDAKRVKEETLEENIKTAEGQAKKTIRTVDAKLFEDAVERLNQYAEVGHPLSSWQLEQGDYRTPSERFKRGAGDISSYFNHWFKIREEAGMPVTLSQEQYSAAMITHEAVIVGGELLSGVEGSTGIFGSKQRAETQAKGVIESVNKDAELTGKGNWQPSYATTEEYRQATGLPEVDSGGVAGVINSVVEVAKDLISPSTANAAELPVSDATPEQAPQAQVNSAAQVNSSGLQEGHRLDVEQRADALSGKSVQEVIHDLEGHKYGTSFIGENEEGVFGLTLDNFNTHLGTNRSASYIPTNAEADKAYGIHMEKIVDPIMDDLQRKGVQFSDNEDIAMRSLLWNTAKGSRTLKSLAPNAYKAFLRGDKDTAFEELFSSSKGLRKEGGEVVPGLVNRRAIEWLLAASEADNAPEEESILAKMGSIFSPSSAEAATEQQEPSQYVIKSGDTLSGIARDTKIPMEQLMQLNQISNPNKIRAGQILNLEAISQEAPPEPEKASTPEYVEGVVPKNMLGSLEPTMVKSARENLFGFDGVRTMKQFKADEQVEVRRVAKIAIDRGRRTGNYKFSYSDYDEEGGKGLSYQMDEGDIRWTDPAYNAKMTIGEGRVVRHKGKLYVADEVNFVDQKFLKGSDEYTGEKPLDQRSVKERLKFILKEIEDKGFSLYGLGHRLNEAFGAGMGKGASLRAELGTAKDFGLSAKEFKKIPTLKSYEQDKLAEGAINKKNLGKIA